MPSVSVLLRRLKRRVRPRPEEIRPNPRDRLLDFAEFLAVVPYLDFDVLPLEFWPGYRDAVGEKEDTEPK